MKKEIIKILIGSASSLFVMFLFITLPYGIPDFFVGWVVCSAYYTAIDIFEDCKIAAKKYEERKFTGLYDKKGVGICEGDWVECDYGVGKVIFHSGCYMVEWLSDPEANMEFLFSRDGKHTRTEGDQFTVIYTT